MYDSKYIESDAFLMACEGDTSTLMPHLEQFTRHELGRLHDACFFLAQCVEESKQRHGGEE